jgi:hypothetical protein
VKNTIWPHECSSGTFWDGYSGGGCWQCPSDTPRRTAYAVWADNACASATNQTRTATMVSFNGCSAPNVPKLKSEAKLTGKEMPGKPFLDIAGGWSEKSSSGGCYTCPVVDSDGNFLISERNLDPIYGDKNTGCNILLKYKPAKFASPGLSGLNGFKNRILEANLMEPNSVTSFLSDLAEAYGKTADSTEARTWVGGQWEKIAEGPYKNDSFRLLMLGALKNAIDKEAAARTPAETAMIAAMESYITNWRTYMAQQALDMYSAWKQWDDTNQLHAKSRLVQMFDFGTVPLDFEGLTTALATPSAVGASIGSAIAGAQAVGRAVAAATNVDNVAQSHEALFYLFKGTKVLSDLAKGTTMALGTVGGATIIAAGFAVISAVATDQFMQILTARSKLEAALAEARKPISLSTLLKQKNGADLLEYYWLMALDSSTEREDPQVVQMAVAANKVAKATGYAKPKK